MTRIVQLLESINTHLSHLSIQKKVLEPEEAAVYCGLGRSTFFEYVAAGVIPKVRFPGLRGRKKGKVGYRVSDLDEFIDSLEME